MTEFRDFLAKRRSEVQARIAEIEAALAPLQAEMLDIARAERAILCAATGRKPHDAKGPDALSIQGMVLQVLETSAEPLNTAQVQSRVGTTFGRTITRTSLAPQMSRLVRKGLIVREGGAHALAPRPTAGSGRTEGEVDG